MQRTDRTFELPVPASDGPAQMSGATKIATYGVASVAGTEQAWPVFPNASGESPAMAPASPRQRPSPALDPLARAQISRFTKWAVLAAVLLFVAWFPAYLYSAGNAAVNASADLAKSGYYLAAVTSAAIFAAVIATGLPRAILPGVFGRRHETVEALRDWMAVGLTTGGVYWLAIIAARSVHVGMDDGGGFHEWIVYRLPLLLVSGVAGVFVARIMAIQRDNILGEGAGNAVVQMLLQVGLLVVFERPLEMIFPQIARMPEVASFLGAGATVCTLSALGIIAWSVTADADLTSMRRRRGSTGVVDGAGPVNLKLTVIGGRESGKTVLLAAAFYEWSTQRIGNLRITPANDAAAGGRGASKSVESLEDVARELYVNHEFPVGTVSTRDLPFDLSLGQEKIARFSFLDYPGGAIASRVADDSVVQDFWEQVEDTDGIMLIADMSFVRRAQRDNDFLEVRNAYLKVMQRLVDRNGKRRVVPVALVLTKCDEFIDPETGNIDMEALNEGLHEFQYHELEEEWRQLNEQSGPGFVEFSTWITSAITYSKPQLGPNGTIDYSRPFQIAPAPPAITPTGCASPLLWMTSKVMRWNVTLFCDISTFLFGSTPNVHRRVEAVLEMERIADERARKS